MTLAVQGGVLRNVGVRNLNADMISRYEEWLRVQRYSKVTTTRYLGTAGRFAGFLNGRLLTTTSHSDVHEYLGLCARQGCSGHVLNVHLLALRSLFDFLSLGGLMKWVPPRLISLRYAGPRFPRFLPRRQIASLFRATRNTRERLIIEMLYGTGCRSCEFSLMRVEDIDFEERRVRVKSKARRTRLLMLTPRLIRLLRKYLGGRRSGYVLADGRPIQKIRPYPTPSGGWYTHYRTYDSNGRPLGLVTRFLPSGKYQTETEAVDGFRSKYPDRIERPVAAKPISIYGIHLAVQRIGVRAGVRICPRMLRHSLATHLMDNGADLRVVSACLGHSHIKTTTVYLHLSQKFAQRSFEQHHPLNARGSYA